METEASFPSRSVRRFVGTAALPELVALVAVVALLCVPASGEGLKERIEAAMASESRSPAERARDANRKPVETLTFLGIEEEMRVLELVPGGGWYTRLLAPALGGSGELHVWIGLGRYAERMQKPEFRELTVVAPEVELVPSGRRGIYDLPSASFGRDRYDAVLTFRNLHNLSAPARAELHRAVFEALRPGGIYGIVDHTRRHMEPDGAENRRRLDPVVALQEALAAGFVFEAWSDLHFRADDELRFEVGRRSVAGNTDRFTFRLRKPR